MILLFQSSPVPSMEKLYHKCALNKIDLKKEHGLDRLLTTQFLFE